MAFVQTRDLRSDAHAMNREKEHREKWSFGVRPLAGVLPDRDNQWLAGNEGQPSKSRPGKPSSTHEYHYTSHNVVKPRNGRLHDIPQSHSRAKCDALVELQDHTNLSRSLHELLPGDVPQRSPTDNILYSFDRQDTPGKPLSLDFFVKQNPKETEKLVEKEYEVLDQNGDALRGRKARQNLRRKNAAPFPEQSLNLGDEEFELV